MRGKVEVLLHFAPKRTVHSPKESAAYHSIARSTMSTALVLDSVLENGGIKTLILHKLLEVQLLSLHMVNHPKEKGE